MAWTTPGTAVAGDVLTAAFWNEQVRDNSDYLKTEVDAIETSIKRLGYVSRTTSYSVTATSVAGAADVFASDITFTALASTAYRIEFFCHRVDTASNAGASVVCHLVDGSGNDLGRLTATGNGNGTQNAFAPAYAVYYYTPGAGSISINIRAFRAVATGTLAAGAGGSGNEMPMYLAVFGPSLT